MAHQGNGLMRQAILRAPRVLDLVDVPTPAPGPGEVLVHIRAALTCGTDLKTYRRGHPRLPFGPFGHEAAGDVLSIGAGVVGYDPGQPVVFTPTAPCGSCEPCRRGRENLCTTLFHDMALGAYADVLRLPVGVVRHHLFEKPSRLSYVEAAFLEPLACVIHAWGRLGPINGGRVAVVGVGPIGLLHVLEARRRGLEVIAVGRRSEALVLAQRAGARHIVNATEVDVGEALRTLTGDGPELIIECTGSVAVWQAAPSWAAAGGCVLLFGGLPGGSEPEFDATRLHYSEVNLISAFHYNTRDVHDALRLLDEGAVTPAVIITAARPLDDIRQVFADLDRGAGIKYAVVPDGDPWH